jgi:hypothetical protein
MTTYGVERKLLRSTSEVDETTRQGRKKRMKMINSQPGTTSHQDEVLDKRLKVKPEPAHVSPGTPSHERENLDGRKKRVRDRTI